MSTISYTPTPHNAALLGQIAPTVLMPSDPLRAKYIAEKYLENPICYNTVRGMLGYTGTYQGHRLSVQGSGMGCPSIGIYSYELYHYYNVENIIRIGSAGGLSDDVQLRDIVVALGSCTDSNYGRQFALPGAFAPIASYSLLSAVSCAANKLQIPLRVGNVFCSDCFYDETGSLEKWKQMGVLAVEMESAALYMNAARAGKSALCIATISDHPFKGLSLPAKERETSFTQMMELALETVCEVDRP